MQTQHSTQNEERQLSSEAFRAAFRRHPGGVAVITATAGDAPVALTATSVSSVSADPPILVFSVSEASSSAPTIKAAETVVVHFIDADNVGIAQLGATHGIDRFADTSIWTRLETGEVVFHVVPIWIRARILERIDAGGSTIFLAQALHSEGLEDSDQISSERHDLVYVDRAWHRLGDHSKID